MKSKKVNLFVYGSLRESSIFKSVSGRGFTLDPSKADDDTLIAEPALLSGYRRVSPDNVYFYAVKDETGRIEGYIIYGLNELLMADIDKYEGKRYRRETVNINTAHGLVEAQAYLTTTESMKKHFGDRFHVNLIHELWLRKRIEDFIASHTRPGEKSVDADLERRAERELLATTERDLVISHYGADAVSDYYLEHELNRPRPSISHLRGDCDAQQYANNYLSLVVKQVLLNQFDEKIQTRYRYELERMGVSERYFKRSVSLLAALQMINANSAVVALIIDQALEKMNYRDNDLIDYVKYAINAADSIFDQRIALAHIERIRANFQPGLIPMGAELELSNVGKNAVNPDSSRDDTAYESFRYFTDFRLDVLAWKLGGYIDDHRGESQKAQKFGFLELAPGRLNLAGELSRPATAGPWVLNQLIHAISAFYNVRPHSLHLSFQLRKNQIGEQKILPLGFVKCLLVLGGGLEQHDGKLWVSRMKNDEIKQLSPVEELVFTRTSKRKWYMPADETAAAKTPKQALAVVQQYKFIRLEHHANYEPLIMCLKGLQIGYNPADYLTADQLKTPRLRRDYEKLKEWSENPSQISPRTINEFVRTVRYGLMNEAHHRPAHKLHYIDWAISAIDVQLRMFNKQLRQT
ncbi:MAG: gamma-glutamylcyclotransferase [Phycisphaerae bacterium]|nr:gamma-glutamylcyclotransferase [Phycisphaerae bacterium]